ncbi:MAG: hypothetical protein IH621_17120 [Krumholzibacteria bacterium]|nr:hypothetical protein [Candidatus Krumholzibacteria bacterium]
MIRTVVVSVTLLAVCCESAAAHPGSEYNEDNLWATVANAHIAAIGVVEDTRWSVDPESNSDLLVVDLKLEEILSGQRMSRITVAIGGLPGTYSATGVDPSRPEQMQAGDRYVFLVLRRWSWAERRYLDDYVVPYHGVLCLDASGEMEPCTAAIRYTIEDPLGTLRRCFEDMAPDELFGKADLVVEVKRIADARTGRLLDDEQTPANLSCDVLRVLKGRSVGATLLFSSHSGDFRFPQLPFVGQDDLAIIFLEYDKDGIARLIGGSAGYYRNLSGRLLDRAGHPTRYVIRAGAIVDAGDGHRVDRQGD